MSLLARKASAPPSLRQEDTERLVRVTAAIADAVTADQVYEAVVDLAGREVSASSAALWVREEQPARMHLVRSYGYPEGLMDRFSSVPFDGVRLPVLDAVVSGNPVFIGSAEELRARYPQFASGVLGTIRETCLPIIVDDRILGALSFRFERPSFEGEDERRFLMLVTRYGGQAIERLRLLDAERGRRARAEAAACRMAVLDHATGLFSAASTDLDALLAAVAEQVAVQGADACAVVVFADADSPRRVAVHPREHAPSAAGEELAANASKSLGNSSEIASLVARGKRIGAVVSMRGEERGAFTAEQRSLFAELADRAAPVVEKALLYEAGLLARRRAELLYCLARAIIGAETEEEMLEAALDAVECATSASRSAVLVADAEGVMRFRAHRGLSERYRAAVEGHSPWPRDEGAPEPVVIGDVHRAPKLARLLPVIDAERIRTMAFIPLVAYGRLIGQFMVYYERPRELSSQELEVARAIANQVASALERVEAVAELRETVRFNEMFTAILGHDLRNPLGAIMASTQLVLKRIEDDKVGRPLRRILSGGQRMARMIDQLLDFTRVRVGGGLSLSPARMDLAPLLGQIIDDLGTSSGCDVRLESHGDTLGEWDADRLGQVFSNLVGNAVQHGVPTGAARVRVDGVEPDVVRVDVFSGGVIPKDLLPKLFEPMTGGDTRREKSQGLGLGLFITRQIVREHCGSIEVESSEPAGTVFRVVLPRAAVRPPGLL